MCRTYFDFVLPAVLSVCCLFPGCCFHQIAVTYDENTLFAIKTIYDGGARFEMSAATAADLASGQFIQVWGSSSGSGLKATQICIVKVA